MSHKNKGLESLAIITNKNQQKFFVGLCEGNYCSGGYRGQSKGHGRILILNFTASNFNHSVYHCKYNVIQVSFLVYCKEK